MATCYSTEERAVLAYTDCLALQAGRTPEAVFEALKAFLDDEQILELTYIVCLYDMHAVMSRALRTEYDDRDDPDRRNRRPRSLQRQGLPGYGAKADLSTPSPLAGEGGPEGVG